MNVDLPASPHQHLEEKGPRYPVSGFVFTGSLEAISKLESFAYTRGISFVDKKQVGKDAHKRPTAARTPHLRSCGHGHLQRSAQWSVRALHVHHYARTLTFGSPKGGLAIPFPDKLRLPLDQFAPFEMLAEQIKSCRKAAGDQFIPSMTAVACDVYIGHSPAEIAASSRRAATDYQCCPFAAPEPARTFRPWPIGPKFKSRPPLTARPIKQPPESALASAGSQ